MQIKGMKILVTGGAGFIGSHIVSSLVSAGAQVTVLDNLQHPAPCDVVELGAELVKGDVRDYSSVRSACHSVDLVSHQAAQLEIITSLENPEQDLATNTIGTINVLRAAHEGGAKKVVVASSACVYGEARYIPQDEDHPTVPNWPYGVSKLAAERYGEVFSKYYSLPVVALRYGIVYGEREWFGRVMSVFTKRAIAGQSPVVWGDGHQVRDFIHVDDVVSLHNLILTRENVREGSYNVSTSVGTSIIELASRFSLIFGLPSPIFEPISEGQVSVEVPGRLRLPLELRRMVLSNSRSRQLGWSPRVSLDEGIRREAAWSRANPSAWTDLYY